MIRVKIQVMMMVRKGRLKGGTRRRRNVVVEVDLKTVIVIRVMKLSMGRAIVIIAVMNDTDQGVVAKVIPSPHRENKHMNKYIALVNNQRFVCVFIESHALMCS